MGESYFEITGAGNYLRLEPIRLNYPDAEDLWDRKWLNTNIIVKGGRFQGTYSGDLTIDNFKYFKDMLSTLYNNISSQFEFIDLEENLEIKVNGDGIGHFFAQVAATDTILNATLKFSIEFDQTQIPKMIMQLEKILTKFS